VAAHQVQNATEISRDPQLEHQRYWATVEHPLHGPTVIEGTRFALSRTPARIERSAPMLGQHISDVLLDLLGYDGDRLAELAAAEAFD
jgi:crotonobetainyl-CoA:carnitine CoA-transferase CaiB-like acyl-CoA transferase